LKSAIDEWTAQKKPNHQGRGRGRGIPYALQLNLPQRSNQKAKKRR